MTDKVIITRPGEYCRADGVKVRVEAHDGSTKLPYYGDDGYYREADGMGIGVPPERYIISTWADRPDEFRKLPDAAPEPTEAHDGKGQTLVLIGRPGGSWSETSRIKPTHRLTLHIDTAGNATGKMEEV